VETLAARIREERQDADAVHSRRAENDVPISEAEQMYTALRRAELKQSFSGTLAEGHGLREPLHRVDQITRLLAWFDSHLQH